MRELGCDVIMGNWDAAFLGDMPEPTDEVGKQLVEINQWWAGFLSDSDREFMRSFQPKLELELDSRPCRLLSRLAGVLRRLDLRHDARRGAAPDAGRLRPGC